MAELTTEEASHHNLDEEDTEQTHSVILKVAWQSLAVFQEHAIPSGQRQHGITF
jgi:hypothetical protein